MELSVILISKNQAWNMGRLIKSVMQNTASVASVEIVLVDSASTDRTTEVAAQYPVRVLRLRPTQYLTPAAGRYIGYKHTTGKFILFLDGDMELVEGWLERAFYILRNDAEVALVTGKTVDLPKEAKAVDKPFVAPDAFIEAINISYSGGAAMCRRSILEEVGTFNPYLYSDEEPDLCIRIRYAGYHIVRVLFPIVFHYTDPRGGLSTQVARWKRGLYLGAGQNLRYHLGEEILWPYIKERGFGLMSIAVILVILLSLVWASLTANTKLWVLMWGALFGLSIVGDALRKRSFYKTISSLLKQTFILDGTIRGFLLTPLDPNTYPDEFDLLK